MPIGVVVGVGLAEVRQRRHHVRRVLAQIVKLRLGLVHLRDQVLERARGRLRERRGGLRERDQVAGALRVANQRVELADRRDRGVDQLPQLGGERLQAPDPHLRGVDERIERVERRIEAFERRGLTVERVREEL